MPNPTQSADGKYWPDITPDITNAYHLTNNRYRAGYHTGVDFAGSIGDPVYSALGGMVVETLDTGKVGYGKQITIKQADGTYALYGHLSKIDVAQGQAISSGEYIGKVGNTGNSTGSHLHFEIRNKNKYGSDIDPLGWLKMAYDGNATTSGGTVTAVGYRSPNTGTPQTQQTFNLNPLAPLTEPITGFFAIITNGQFWIRVLEIAFGILLLMWGTSILTTGSSIPGVGSTLKAVKSIGAKK